jgi:predicted dehydrogenase
MKRRNFVRTMAAASAVTAASSSRVLGANDRINVGLIGCGGRGTFDTRLIRANPEDRKAMSRGGEPDPRIGDKPRGVEVTGLCDVWQQRIDRAKQWAPDAKEFTDFRKLLDDKDIDVVVIATQDQWHVPMAILACEAGKDIYLEKPVMYSIAEGKAVVEAVRKNKRIVQIGSQHRSAEHIAEAAKIVQSGKIGEVYWVRVWNNLQMGKRTPKPDSAPPAGLNWDMWLGPAPKVPYNEDRLGYRSFMDYTNGLISDYGMHRLDSVSQIMGVSSPKTVSASWGKFQPVGVGDLPDIHQATYEFDNFILSYECCTVNSLGLGGPRTPGHHVYGGRGPNDRPHGMAYYGTEAALFVDRLGMQLFSEPKPGPRGSKWEPRMKEFSMNEPEPTPLHAKNFVENIRDRKEPFANIEAGVNSTIIPILGNIAAREDRKLHWDGDAVKFENDKKADKALFRPYRKPWDLVEIG